MHKEAIITAPLSKTQIRDEGFSEIGHTEILKKLTGINELNMAFVGKYFSMVLYTDHIPISSLRLELKSFEKFVSRSIKFYHSLRSTKPEIRVLGFNPHAGDQGLIGKEDQQILKLMNKKHGISKLWPADSAFINYKKFKNKPLFLSSYHDQGLIPFKMAHGFTGYHHTLGLPFIRTSVDHGTAKEIFNKNLADPKSMIDAIVGAIKLKKGVL
jgi:4-hydroxy-L-threonine phosphate dehydrogenase PdxA